MFRRLYNWVLSWANTPYGSAALFVMAFAESSFFPIPPDVLQIALSVSKPRRAFWYAAVSLAGSVLGAVLGYYIGFQLWTMTQTFFFAYIPGFTPELFDLVSQKYAGNAFLAVFTAAFTPIPYKIFTIAAGVCQISLWTLLLASVAGRGMRFFLVAGLMFAFGPPIKVWIDKYLDVLAIVFTILLIGGFVIVKFLFA
ncbi:MAG: VTT domain-containing protein [Planctomycetaceae bacterium]|nr:VTT domain-containing protein [Planctomycetaceae bacterium]